MPTSGPSERWCERGWKKLAEFTMDVDPENPPRRRAEPPTDEKIRRMAAEIAAATRAERIHLVGSAADDRWREGDDTDFIAVADWERWEPGTFKKLTEIFRRFRKASTDLSAYSPEVFDLNCRKWWMKEYGAVDGGRVAYEKPGTAPWRPPIDDEPDETERLGDAQVFHRWGTVRINRAARAHSGGKWKKTEIAEELYGGTVECLQGLLIALNVRGWLKDGPGGLIKKAGTAGLEIPGNVKTAAAAAARTSTGDGGETPSVQDLETIKKAARAAANWSRRTVKKLKAETDERNRK